jgi:hypothetical protein
MQHQLRGTAIVLWMPHGLAQNGAQVFMMAIEAAAVWVLSPAYRATTAGTNSQNLAKQHDPRHLHATRPG